MKIESKSKQILHNHQWNEWKNEINCGTNKKKIKIKTKHHRFMHVSIIGSENKTHENETTKYHI